MGNVMGTLIALMFVLVLPITSHAVIEDTIERTTTDRFIDTKPLEGEAAENVTTEEATREEMIGALISEWETNGYPDDVGHIYYDSDTGKYMIGLVNADERRKDEIRSMTSNPDIVDFDDATYSYNELLAVQREIERDMSKQTNEMPHIYTVATGWTSIDGDVTGFGASGKEFRVVVGVAEHVYAEYAEKYANLYGDKVHVEIGNEIVIMEDVAEGNTTSTWMYLSLIFMLCIVMLIWFFNRNREKSNIT